MLTLPPEVSPEGGVSLKACRQIRVYTQTPSDTEPWRPALDELYTQSHMELI